MSAIATAIAGSAIIGAGTSLLAAGAQAGAAKEGMALEKEMSDDSLALQRELTEVQREDFAPWRDVGGQALERIWSGIQAGDFEVGDIDVTKDPGYQFRLEQGIEARDASASARGRLQSGAQAKAITEYGQDYASNEYAKAYAREANEKARQFNILSGLSGMGQASAARQAGATGQLAGTSANIMAGTGRGMNISAQNIGSARASGYQDVATGINQAAQNWLTYKMNTPTATPAPVNTYNFATSQGSI